MIDRENVIKWFEYDYLPRVGAYRKDCKQGCDACAPMHDGDNYCDIDMLCKVLAMLKEQEEVVHPEPSCEMTYITDCCCDRCGVQLIREDNFCRCCGKRIEWESR